MSPSLLLAAQTDRGSTATSTRDSSRRSLFLDTGRRPLFFDIDSLKSQVREVASKNNLGSEDLYHETGFFPAIARHRSFEAIGACSVILNAIWVGIYTDCNKSNTLLRAHWSFQIAEATFGMLFFLEWLIRFMAFKNKLLCFKMRSFVFDTCLIVATFLATMVLAIPKTGNVFSLVLTLVRFLRLFRLLNLLRKMPEINLLFTGLLVAIRTVFYTLIFLIMVMYIFAIALCHLSNGTVVGERYFGSVRLAMHTLLVYGTFLDELGRVSADISGMDSDGNALLGILFWLFVGMGALVMMNVLVGMICEVVRTVANAAVEDRKIAYAKKRLMSILSQFDDGTEMITKADLPTLLTQVEAIRAFEDVGVDPIDIVDLADSIFQGEEELDIPAFMNAILDVRAIGTTKMTEQLRVAKLLSNSANSPGKTTECEMEVTIRKDYPRPTRAPSQLVCDDKLRSACVATPCAMMPEQNPGIDAHLPSKHVRAQAPDSVSKLGQQPASCSSISSSSPEATCAKHRELADTARAVSTCAQNLGSDCLEPLPNVIGSGCSRTVPHLDLEDIIVGPLVSSGEKVPEPLPEAISLERCSSTEALLCIALQALQKILSNEKHTIASNNLRREVDAAGAGVRWHIKQSGSHPPPGNLLGADLQAFPTATPLLEKFHL